MYTTQWTSNPAPPPSAQSHSTATQWTPKLTPPACCLEPQCRHPAHPTPDWHQQCPTVPDSTQQCPTHQHQLINPISCAPKLHTMQAHVLGYHTGPSLDHHLSDTMKVISTKPLPQNPQYLISTCGQVYDSVEDRWMTLSYHHSGLLVHYQHVNSIDITTDAHHLVAEVHMPGYCAT